jgi:hypothetical protein
LGLQERWAWQRCGLQRGSQLFSHAAGAQAFTASQGFASSQQLGLQARRAWQRCGLQRGSQQLFSHAAGAQAFTASQQAGAAQLVRLNSPAWAVAALAAINTAIAAIARKRTRRFIGGTPC